MPQPRELTCSNCQATFPVGGFCPACGPVPLHEAAADSPDLEEILRASQGITPDTDGAMRAMATLHAMWRRAWRDTGEFTEEETFELVRIMVASASGGIRSLG
jgi:hypothetical protein